MRLEQVAPILPPPPAPIWLMMGCLIVVGALLYDVVTSFGGAWRAFRQTGSRSSLSYLLCKLYLAVTFGYAFSKVRL